MALCGRMEQHRVQNEAGDADSEFILSLKASSSQQISESELYNFVKEYEKKARETTG